MIQFKHTNVIIFAFIINLTCFNINFHFLNCRRNEAQDFYYEGEYYNTNNNNDDNNNNNNNKAMNSYCSNKYTYKENGFLVQAFGDHGGDDLTFLEDDDDYSSFVMPEKFDFDVTFPYNSGQLGLKISDVSHIVTSIKDNYAADLTGMIKVGDQLIAINDIQLPPLNNGNDSSNSNKNNKNRDNININEKLKFLEKNNHKQWFYLRFRPAIFEKRTRADLYDVNVTIKQGETLGLLLSSNLKILKVEQQIGWKKTLSVENGNSSNNSSKTNNNNIASSQASTLTTTSGNAANLVPGDKLIMINDRSVVTKKLNDVLPILKGLSTTTMNNDQNNRKKTLKLRFRPPLEVREQRKLLKKLTDENVNYNNQNTFTVTFVDKGPVGINFDEKLIVQNFGLPDGYEVEDDATEEGTKIDSILYFPAERNGHIIIGDRLISVNGEKITTLKKANELLNVPVKSKRLHCRGGVHCGIEIVRNTPDVRTVTFAIGRRDRQNVNANNNDNMGKMYNNVDDGTSMNLMQQQNDNEKSMYKMNNNNNNNAMLLAKTAINANGMSESVFYAKRGIIDIVDSKKVDIGSFDFTAALFGGPLWCKHHEIYIPDPEDACEELANEKYLRNKYVLVKRGRCYFSTKAIHAQYAGAAGLIVVDSEENKGKLPKRMPGAENDRHLIKIPSIMISYLDGQKIIKALKKLNQQSDSKYRKITDLTLHGTLRTEEHDPKSTCKYTSDDRDDGNNAYGNLASSYDHTKMPSASNALHEKGGHIEILNSNGQVVNKYEYLTAKFGQNLLLKAMTTTIKVANPNKACSDITNDIDGSVVIIQRGTCSLVEKIERAEKAGAVAALIINNKNGLERIETWDQKFRPYYVKSKHNVTILAGMVTKQAGVELLEMLHDVSAKKNIIARLISNGGHVEQWNQLTTLFDIGSWPKDPNGRAQLYLEFAKKNNPNIEYGSNERFQCLQLARKIVETHYAGIKLREKLIKEREQREAAAKNME